MPPPRWCLLLLTLLNRFQCCFLCVYKTVNHAPFRGGWNTAETSKTLGRKSQWQLCSFTASTSHTHIFPHRGAAVGPSCPQTRAKWVISDRAGSKTVVSRHFKLSLQRETSQQLLKGSAALFNITRNTAQSRYANTFGYGKVGSA